MRERIGRPLNGWRPYGNWANPRENPDAEYLHDDKTRIHDWRSRHEGPLAIEEGVNRIRKVLALPRGVVRLIGLSGTGKTRLVQALFDDRFGDQSLSPALVIYADLADLPEPSPRDLMSRLVQIGSVLSLLWTTAPDTHRALASIARRRTAC